jgi:hypothetical protein
MRRARFLTRCGSALEMPARLQPFMQEALSWEQFRADPALLDSFSMLDDYDIWYCIKSWVSNPDFILRYLARGLMDRRLLKVGIRPDPLPEEEMERLREAYRHELGISKEEVTYLVFEKEVSNSAYISGNNRINVKFRNGEIRDIAEASDLPNIQAMTALVKKYIVCQPKNISLRLFPG